MNSTAAQTIPLHQYPQRRRSRLPSLLSELLALVEVVKAAREYADFATLWFAGNPKVTFKDEISSRKALLAALEAFGDEQGSSSGGGQ